VSDPRREPEESPVAEEGGVRWDASALQVHRAQIASATTTADAVVLNFGAALADEGRGSIAIRLLRQIAVTPLTAKRLQEMLSKVLSLHDARRRS
jgi:hypothetical protein